MKKFTLFVTAAMGGLLMQGASPRFCSMLKSPVTHISEEVSDEVIWYAPEGEVTWLSRSCDGFVTQAFDATHGQVIGSVVQMVETEDGEVYLSHMASEYPVDTWIKAMRVDNTIVIEGIQPIYMEYDYDTDEDLMVYLVPMEKIVDESGRGTFVATDDLRYVFDITEDGSLVAADPELLLGVCVHTPDENVTGNAVWVWKGFGDRDITMSPNTASLTELPEGLSTENWVWKDQYDNAFVEVAIDGEDFYINGMDRSLPDAWIKGKINEGKVEFPSGQYLGADMEILYYSYFCGADFTVEEDEEGYEVLKSSLAESAIFAYDKENKTLTTERGYVINSAADKLYPLYAYDQVTVKHQQRNPSAPPAAPYDLMINFSDWGNSIWFQLPNTDVDGNLLMEKNLYYEVYVDGELQTFSLMDEDWEYYESTRIPYAYDDDYDFYVYGTDHTVYLIAEEIGSVGIRSVYINENGEEIYSDLITEGTTGVADIEGGRKIVSEKCYDLQGRMLRGSTPGVVIKVVTYSDGTEDRIKMISNK